MDSSPRGRWGSRILTGIALVLLLGPGATRPARAQAEEDPLEPLIWGKLQLYPSLLVSYESEDNVRRKDEADPVLGRIASGVRDVSPQIRLEVPLERTHWELSYHAQIRDYTAGELQDANGVSHFFDGSVSFPIAPSTRLELLEHYVRGRTELLEVDPGGELRFGTRPFVTQSSRAIVRVEAGPVQAIEAGAVVDSTRFEEEAGSDFLFDAKGNGLYALYSFATSPSNRLFVAVDYQEVKQDRGSFELEPTDYTRRSLGGGIRRQMTPSMTSEFRAAYSSSRFEDDREPPFRGATLEGSLNTQMGPRGGLSLKLRRTPRPSYFNTSAYYVNDSLQLQFRQRIGQRVGLQLEGTLQANKYPQAVRVAVSGPDEARFDEDGDGLLDPYEFLLLSDGTRRQDRLRSSSAILSVQLVRGVRLQVGYRRDRVDSNLRAELEGELYDPFDYTSRETTAAVVLGWP